MMFEYSQMTKSRHYELFYYYSYFNIGQNALLLVLSLLLLQHQEKKISLMAAIDFFQNTILRMDLLSSQASFRVRKQSSYETIFGGIFSLLLMTGFTYVLAIQLQNMFGKLDITYTSGLADNVSSQNSIDKLQLAISIDGVNLTTATKSFMYFLDQNTMEVVNGTRTFVKTPIILTQCRISDWQNVGIDFQNQFNAFGFNKMLCIDQGQSYSMNGYIGSQIYSYLTFKIAQCNQTIDNTCDSATNINSFITNYLTKHDYFKVRFFLVDTILTPSNQQAISYIIEKNIFMAFTQTVGTVGFINMAQWSMTTDSSSLPYQNNQVESGSYIEDFQTNSVSISSTNYVSVDFYRSTKALSITRTIGKIDVVLSYVGGLFSLIFTAIAFFISSYSSMKYELYVAGKILNSYYKGFVIGQQTFGFWLYLRYCFYDWMDAFGVAPSCMEKMQKIHEAREQACEQLDPALILRRIKYLEDVSSLLLSEHRELALHLAEPMTLKQAKKLRRLINFYDKCLRDQNFVEQKRQNSRQLGKGVANSFSQAIILQQLEYDEEQQQDRMQKHMKQAILQVLKDEGEIGNKILKKINRKIQKAMLFNSQRQIQIYQFDSKHQIDLK